MPTEVVPYHPDHLRQMSVQKDQGHLEEWLKENPGYPEEIDSPGLTHTLIGDGEVLFIGGAVIRHPGVAEVWAILTDDALRRRGVTITRGVRKFLDLIKFEHGIHRIFTMVDMDFDAGHRWARILGFEPEGICRKYRPNKADCMLYARVEDG